MREYFIIFLTILCCCNLPVSRGEADDFVPWNFDRPTAGKQKTEFPPDLSLSAEFLYRGSLFFSQYISPVDGDRCAMYPTCSAYSRQAVARHGFLIGLVMTVDRLIHENNEIDTARVIEIGGSYRYHDPVENNDFWWDQQH